MTKKYEMLCEEKKEGISASELKEARKALEKSVNVYVKNNKKRIKSTFKNK